MDTALPALRYATPLGVRLTATERAIITEAARRTGHTTSGYIRAAAIEAARADVGEPRTDTGTPETQP